VPADHRLLPDTRLEGRTAMVIGAGGFNGSAVALGLAEAGADVAVVARTPEAIDGAAEGIRRLGRRAVALAGDSTDSARIDEIVDLVGQALGTVDILCNVAGSSARNVLVDTTDDAWDAIMRANVYGPFFATRSVARRLIAAGHGGAVINVTSTSSVSTMPNLTAYATAKAALSHFTRAAATELAPAGIRVNARMLGLFQNAADRIAGTPLHEMVRQATPMDRWGQQSDTASATVFLASEASSYVTGEVLRLTGGAYSVG
jgi:NAD(P)-dependent dehydrogenase (short-subunit alcohol dehydrogenase family)